MFFFHLLIFEIDRSSLELARAVISALLNGTLIESVPVQGRYLFRFYLFICKAEQRSLSSAEPSISDISAIASSNANSVETVSVPGKYLIFSYDLFVNREEIFSVGCFSLDLGIVRC